MCRILFLTCILPDGINLENIKNTWNSIADTTLDCCYNFNKFFYFCSKFVLVSAQFHFSHTKKQNPCLLYFELASIADVADRGPSSVMSGFSVLVQPAEPALPIQLLCEQ